ncbi:hypothetical protein HBH70_221860 [Parastagonospora nodorum]|nr:hypothetical protein HBH51_232130 [Parastagonospora nodorum]KAH4062810.1 hypothetical protein HBH50_202490 [Parastagonospora nodorum]KAH4081571.1 hypothetical protein HBH48_198140 [Parastagonospora nodorum]KAH4084488.1 hypothetical protein HBH46_212890 [Parastagonospora nodorum]KAH4181678.1 hypothetical protein HBH42_232880 [Parastagonospora nodorum]
MLRHLPSLRSLSLCSTPPRYPPPAPAPAPENSTNLVNAASADATGLSASRKDGRDKADVKSEKELDKERKKADKNAKFQAKKKAQPGPSGLVGQQKRQKGQKGQEGPEGQG